MQTPRRGLALGRGQARLSQSRRAPCSISHSQAAVRPRLGPSVPPKGREERARRGARAQARDLLLAGRMHAPASSALLPSLEECLTDVLTLIEGLDAHELRTSRLTRQAVRLRFLAGASGIAALTGPDPRLHVELDPQGWAAAAWALRAGDEAAYALLHDAVLALVPSTLSWVRVYRSRLGVAYEQSTSPKIL
jgi:hypothetical protein